MINDPHQGVIALHHIEQAMDALHKMNWAGAQLPLNRTWDDLINARTKIEEMLDGIKKANETKVD